MADPRASHSFAFVGSAGGPGRFNRRHGFALLVVALAPALWFDVPLCPSAAWLGIPCPGCGLTRATIALLQGNWGAALHLHPLVVPVAPLAAFWFGRALLRDLGYGRFVDRLAKLRHAKPPFSDPTPWRWGLLASLLGVWIARFAGFLGGPVQVTTLAAWLSTHRPL